jgi:hypothetical protein
MSRTTRSHEISVVSKARYVKSKRVGHQDYDGIDHATKKDGKRFIWNVW